jgi:hypothetical protein
MATSAAVPIANEIEAAASGEAIDRPSVELIGA